MQRWTSILLAIYGGAILISSQIFGFRADRTKSRPGPLVLGLLILAGATAMLVVGTSLELWVVERVLQGASCAVVWTVGLALLADTGDEDELERYVGVVALAMTGARCLGRCWEGWFMILGGIMRFLGRLLG
ncbi:MAG: hypothetical protein MMC23_002976 [Stictis urceolatum]|nr:hypothetical protein [Stictis urceolata]